MEDEKTFGKSLGTSEELELACFVKCLDESVELEVSLAKEVNVISSSVVPHALSHAHGPVSKVAHVTLDATVWDFNNEIYGPQFVDNVVGDDFSSRNTPLSSSALAQSLLDTTHSLEKAHVKIRG